MAQQTAETDVDDGSPDYAAITPESKQPSEYEDTERRAELLRQIEDIGTPSALNRSELAERYDVSEETITNDLDHLNAYVRSQLGRRRDLEIGVALKRILTGALEEGDHAAALNAALAYDDFVEQRLDALGMSRRIAELEEQLNAVADRFE